MLRTIGMHPKYKGYLCIRLILEQVYKQPELLYKLSTNVYPEIYSSLGISKSCMDKDIRFAIERTWLLGNKEALDRLFGDYGTQTPTMLEFISVLSHALIDTTTPQELQ